MSKIEILFLGTRGSIAMEGSMFSKFGGATSCIIVRFDKKIIILDAGSGLMALPFELLSHEKHVDILISHPHLDHISGLPICPIMYREDMSVNIYAKTHKGLSTKQQIEMLMKPPLWPVTSAVFSKNVNFFEIKEGFNLDDVKISVLDGAHPGGANVFKLEYDGKSIVYATDYELSEFNRNKLCKFCNDCDVLIIDGQYSEEELPTKKGFGHSSFIEASELARKSNSKTLMIFHHDPYSTDEILEERERILKKENPNSFFARRGDKISI